jgi:hypothetical protein
MSAWGPQLPYFVRFRPGAESCQRSPGAARRHCRRATRAILFASRNEISIHLFRLALLVSNKAVQFA